MFLMHFCQPLKHYVYVDFISDTLALSMSAILHLYPSFLSKNKNFLPSILVEEEVLEDDWANEDLQLALVDQIVDGGVHQGELLAHELVTVLTLT